MSIRVMTKVWDTSEQKGSTLLLLLALADHAADDGFCWPGYEHLAQKIRMSTRSVSRLIETLEEDGDLFVIRKKGEHNWYIVRVGLSNQDVIEVLKQRHFDTPDILSSLQEQGTHDNLAGGDDTATPEPMTQQCPTNLHDPSLLNRQREGAVAPHAPAEEWTAEDTREWNRDLAFDDPSRLPDNDWPPAPPDSSASWPVDTTRLPDSPPPNPAQARIERMRSVFGGDPLTVAAHCAERQAAEGTWTVPEHRGLSPACAVFKEATGYRPGTASRTVIDETIPNNEEALHTWFKVCQGWMLTYDNYKNVAGMLDWYAEGRVGRDKPSGNGNGGASTPRREQPSVIELAEPTWLGVVL